MCMIEITEGDNMQFCSEDGFIRVISKYYGEKYFSDDYSLEEAYHLEKKKREKLKKEGFDVDNYDKQHEKFTQEYLSKYYTLDSIFDRAEVYKEYEQKKKDLAKEFFGIDLEDVVMY